MITVVIPTCNRSDYLQETIKSVINQTILPDEVIIVNNGENKIEEELYSSYDFIKIIDIMPYAGVAQARNIGVILSKSRFIAFLDDDDLWEKDYIKKICKIIDDESPDMIVTRVDQLVDGKIISYKDSSKFPEIEDALKFNPGYVGSSIVVKRETFMKIGGFDVRLVTSEDKSLAIEMMRNGYLIQRCSNIQCILRQHIGERLSNHSTMVKGISAFYNKYSFLMTADIKAYNLYKLYRSKWNSKKNIFFLGAFLASGLLYSILKLRKQLR